MIFTSYFDHINLADTVLNHPTFFSISGKTPDWFYDLPRCYSYKLLAPKYSWWKEWNNKFQDNLESTKSKSFYREKYYSTVLNNLNPECIFSELKRLGCYDICLMCYETPDKFCHRQLVSEWFNNNGIYCSELN